MVNTILYSCQLSQASGAGDGVIRLWGVAGERPGAGRSLELHGGLPARGFVNALQVWCCYGN